MVDSSVIFTLLVTSLNTTFLYNKYLILVKQPILETYGQENQNKDKMRVRKKMKTKVRSIFKKYPSHSLTINFPSFFIHSFIYVFIHLCTFIKHLLISTHNLIAGHTKQRPSSSQTVLIQQLLVIYLQECQGLF